MNDAGIDDPLDASMPDISDAAVPTRKDARLERLARQLGSELASGARDAVPANIKTRAPSACGTIDPANFCEVWVLSAQTETQILDILW